MDYFLFKKHVRLLAVRAGIFRPLRNLVFSLRGGSDHAQELDFHRHFIHKGMLVFDVGANRGQSSETFLKLGARVIAFEPQTELHGEIAQACRRSERLTILPLGLGAAEETRRFFKTSYDQVASFRDDWVGKRIGETSIRLSTLDRQIDAFGIPDYCKIDVEGWEIHVFEGLSQAIPLMSFEYHLSESEVTNALDVLERISSLGAYHCNLREPGRPHFALSEFIPIRDFIKRFPNELGVSLAEGYGDIFCSANSRTILQSA
jgi:FkbM family methyltransferase